MHDLWQALTLALRSLRRSHRTTIAILLSLAVGAGANLAIFSVVRATLLAPFPYLEPERLVTMAWLVAAGKRNPVSPGELGELRRQVTSLDEIGAYHFWTFNVDGLERPERITGAVVTANLFPLLGASPALGHAFAGDGPQAPPEILLADGFWRRRFAADPGVLGRQLVLDGEPVTVAGVMAPEFQFPLTRQTDFWKVSPYDEADPSETRFFQVVGRLGDGATLESARAEIAVVAKALAEARPERNQGLEGDLQPLRDSVVQGFERNLWTLQATVAAALLLACFNVGMLQLGRAESRRRDVAVRYALGAGRGQVLRQDLLENLLLGAGGGLAGALVARFGVDLLVRFGPATIYRLDQARVSAGELGLAVALGIVCGVLGGQLPLLAHSRQTLAGAMNPGLRIGAGQTIRRVLVAAQVAVTLVLLVGFGLLVRSLDRLAAVDLGFEPGPVVVTGVSLPQEYGEPGRLQTLFTALAARLEAIPGIEGVATAVAPPLARGFRIDHEFQLVGKPADAADPRRVAAIRPVSPGFFEVLGIPVVGGRAFTAGDDGRAEPVAVVNAAFSRAFTGDARGALDERLAIELDFGAGVGRLPHREWRVVGVVGDVRQVDFEQDEVPAIYVSTLQAPWLETRILAKTGLDPAAMTRQVETAVGELLPELPVRPAQALRDVADAYLAPARFQSGFLGAFAALALVLMGIGLYGSLAYSVSQRTREIGMRIALGAGRWQTRWLVMRQALVTVAIGLVVGLTASFWFGRALASLLYGVPASDPVTYILAIVSMMAVAALAGWLPARRATAVDPVASLRCE